VLGLEGAVSQCGGSVQPLPVSGKTIIGPVIGKMVMHIL